MLIYNFATDFETFSKPILEGCCKINKIAQIGIKIIENNLTLALLGVGVITFCYISWKTWKVITKSYEYNLEKENTPHRVNESAFRSHLFGYHQINRPQFSSHVEKPENDNRPILLFVWSKDAAHVHDYSAICFYEKGKTPEEVATSLNEKYRVEHIIEASSIEHINQEMRQIVGKVQILIIAGHGNPNGIALAENSSINPDNLNQLSLILKEKLAPKATVILRSCNTAAKSLQSNIATLISRALPGKTIWACSKPLNRLIVEISDSSLTCKLQKWISKQEYFWKKLTNILTSQGSKNIPIVEDGTVSILSTAR